MSSKDSIRVAVVDDSSFVRRAVSRLLGDHRRIAVVGTAALGEELLANLEDWRPDVVVLDLAMPGMGGLATLDRLMAVRPTAVIIFSTHSGQGAPQTIEALHRGAVDFIDKQRYSLVDFEAMRQVLLEKILQVADRSPGSRSAVIPSPADPLASRVSLLVIGASTGGPPAIQRLLEDLGSHVPVPVAVAQHMPEGFTRAFAHRMNSHLPFAVREAVHGEHLVPDTVYIAPASYHLTFARQRQHLIAQVRRSPVNIPHRPSIDRLFTSASEVLGAESLGVLLTGMGRDGAHGMRLLADAGAHTLVQDAATSVVFSMPGAAIDLGAAREVLPLARLGPRITELLSGGP